MLVEGPIPVGGGWLLKLRMQMLMKSIKGILWVLFVMLSCSACSDNKMEREFASPPEEVQTAVYWYWISGNISKEGVVDDLNAMKRAGINRAFIGNIGQDGLYTEHNVKLFSDEWWEILHTALKTASELGIEIGIFNSPGWSQSGGPWVKPEQSMRYLASSKTMVSGGKEISLIMEAPVDNFQPVRTIAYPSPENDLKKIQFRLEKSSKIKDLTSLPTHCINEVTVFLDKPTVVRSLILYPSKKPIETMAHLDAKTIDGWKRIADFKVDRSNPALNVGFVPYAPVTISFPAVESDEFRLTLDATWRAGGIEDIELFSVPRVSSYAEKTLAKMCQTPLPYWDHYMWSEEPELDDKSLVIDPAKVIDISDKVTTESVLKWNVPEGNWTILHVGMTPTGVTNSPATPEATGLEIDKMSREHVESHFDAFIGEILRRIPEKDRTTFKVVVEDSYETGGQNITDGMLEDFEATYGYSMLPYLPVYYGEVVGDPQMSERFLWDLRRFIADKVAYEYVGGLKKVSNAHGLTTWLECYGHWGFPGEFLQYGGQSDEIGGEFWSVGELGDIENRAASSCGHIYGKRKIWAESNTSGGPAYSRSPVDMKQRTDRFFTEGINATLLHLYIEQAYPDRYPGINAPYGNEFDAHNTWYSHLDLFTAYLKRCNYMLQQGLNIADVAYLIGEDAPKMTGLQHPSLPKGYQFDYINAEVLMQSAEVVDGKIQLPHGTTYRVLVLPPIETMRPELLEKIKKLVYEGAVVLGKAPHRSPSLQNYPLADAKVEAIARELWGEYYEKQGVNSYGKGTVFHGYNLEEVFAKIELAPDFATVPVDPVLFNHRSMEDAEIYFVSNQSNAPIEFTPVFRVGEEWYPEFWNPVDGSIQALPEFEYTDEGVKGPVCLDALGSGFVVFRPKVTKTLNKKNFPKATSFVEISEPWNLSFEGKLSSPDSMKLDELINLSESDDKELRYFSGTITYDNEFEMTKTANRIMIDLGKVECMAKVYVNGQCAGGTWCEPYKVDITDYVLEGNNTLKIEVVNKWVNRIVGDLQLPVEERKIWLTTQHYKSSSPLPPSGLIGPVKVEFYE